MPDATVLEQWVWSERRRSLLLCILGLLFWVPTALLLIGVAWCLVAATVGAFAGCFFVYSALGLVITTALTAGLLGWLWWENNKLVKEGRFPVDFSENDFEDGDSSLGWKVFYTLLGMAAVLAAGVVPRPRLRLSQSNPQTRIFWGLYSPYDGGEIGVHEVARVRQIMGVHKIITLILFCVPDALLQVKRGIWKCWLLSHIQDADAAAVFQVLLEHEHKVPFAEMHQSLAHLSDPAKALTDLAHFEGVLYLITPPAGMAITKDLRWELNSLSK